MNQFFLSISLVVVFLGSAIAQIDYAEVAFQEENANYRITKPNSPSAVKSLKNKIRSYPDRLDYRYEYLNELSLHGEWNKFTNEVINLVEYSYRSNHNWAWSPGVDAIGDDAEGFLLNTIEDYVFMLYITGEPRQFDHLRSICDVVVEFKPDHVDFLTYPAMTYDALEDYEAGTTYLRKAEELHPNNALISMLIAENYEKRSMVNAALVYYRKALRHGEEDDAKEDVGHIERLSFK